MIEEVRNAICTICTLLPIDQIMQWEGTFAVAQLQHKLSGGHVYEQRRVDLATFRAVPAST